VELLVTYPWPGNVRELAAVIERAAILGDGRTLRLASALGGGIGTAMPAARQAVSSGRPRGAVDRASVVTLDEAMREHIERALTATGGRIEGPRGAAALLNINPHTLRARMRKLGIDWSQFRSDGSSTVPDDEDPHWG
jgi:DNA-binding NtrC family response regulator